MASLTGHDIGAVGPKKVIIACRFRSDNQVFIRSTKPTNRVYATGATGGLGDDPLDGDLVSK